MKKLLTTIIFSLFLGFVMSSPVNASVSGSALITVQEESAENVGEVGEEKEKVDMDDAVKLFSGGIACGLIFSVLIFVFSLVINLFFDIVKK